MNLPSISLLPWWVKPLAIITVLGGIGYGVYHTGYQAAAHDWQAKLDKQKADYESTLRLQAEARAKELAKAAADQQAFAQLAHQLGVTLLATESQLKAKQQQLKQRIPDAIRMDGQHWTGLGPVSLRLYQAELGYTAGDPGLPETNPGDAAKADQADRTGAGLSPEDILAHAGDYGAWCGALEAKFDSLITFHAQASEAQ